jgi:ABC-type antimicrobial peptide transport system permease subunit
VAFTVSERAKEIAIRIALGAKPSHVLSAILHQFFWPIGLGLLIGIVGAAALSKVLRQVLFGISNLDPLSYGAAMGMLLAIATLAALLPARRALRFDPMRVLHCD